MTDGPDKQEQLSLLEKAGFAVPPHGLVGDVMGTWWEAEKKWIRWVVAYEDVKAHCGEGKVVLCHNRMRSDQSCLTKHAELYRQECLFCTAFVGSPHAQPSVSWRLLQIGVHRVWLEYTSKTDWRSNYGDGDISVIGTELNAGRYPRLDFPLFAVDFVPGKELWAVDLNVSPGMRGTGVENILSSKQVVEAIGSFAP